MLNTQLEQVETAEQEWKAQATRFQQVLYIFKSIPISIIPFHVLIYWKCLHLQQLEAEKCTWREKVVSLESELRAKAIQTEQQLALQRERSLALLEDKEQEIRTLKSSFQMFLPLGKNSEEHSIVSNDDGGSEQHIETAEVKATVVQVVYGSGRKR